MNDLVFFMVDVFAQEKFAGNQLAVFVNSGRLSSFEMQKIANEMHFSETTFITSNEKVDGGYNVRIFTPLQEVPFAGHPTLGTAFVIKHFIEKGKDDFLLLNLKVGQIPVKFEQSQNGEEVLWMKQNIPSFGKTFNRLQMAKVLQLEIDDFNSGFPVQEVSTGIPFIIVPLKNLDSVRRATVNLCYLKETASEVGGGILVFCPQTVYEDNDLHVRVFVDLYGIPEDPATGSGNGCLAAYLSHYKYFGNDLVNVKVEQGYEIRRPSLLLLKAESSGKHVEVGGRVFLVAEGKLV